MARNAPGFAMPEKSFIGGKRVRGPGTTTSDSVPAALSKDEFVIKAKSARKLGYNMLDHMNQTGEVPMRMALSKVKAKKAPMPGRMRMRYQSGGSVEAPKGLEAEYDTPFRRVLKPRDVVPAAQAAAAPAPRPAALPKAAPSAAPAMNDAIDLAARRQQYQGLLPGMGESVRRFFKTGGGLRQGYAGGGKAHPGFKAVQAKIAAKQGISGKRAGAILAASSRGASAAAKRANPRLNRVK